jgi:DNA-binding MarR family transcriptional regulator
LVEIHDGHVTVGTKLDERVVDYARSDYENLSADIVDREVLPAAAHAQAPLFVMFRRASAEARQLLRSHGISHAGADGRWFVVGPGLYIERDDRVRAREPRPPRVDGPINPFGVKTSRVARWLLLHPKDAFGIVELARNVELSRASVSRTVAALDDRALVETQLNRANRRNKLVTVGNPSKLLDAWLHEWHRRRFRRLRWDVGSSGVEETLDLLRKMNADSEIVWALGGVAGATIRHRVVEPRDVVVWTTSDDVPLLTEELMPVETLSPVRSNMRVAIAPDAFLFRSVREVDGIPLVDPVQLWLDCMTEGERAMEAAAAIAREQGW